MLQLILVLLFNVLEAADPKVRNPWITLEDNNPVPLQICQPGYHLEAGEFECKKKLSALDTLDVISADTHDSLLIDCGDVRNAISFVRNGVWYTCAVTEEEKARAISCDPKKADAYAN